MIDLKEYNELEKKKIAASPITPQEVFLDLLKEDNSSIDKELAKNKYIPFSIVEALFDKQTTPLLILLSKREDLTKNMFIELAKLKNRNIKENLVNNIACPNEALQILVNDEYSVIRNKALEHKNYKNTTSLSLDQIKSFFSDFSIYEEAAHSNIYDFQLVAAQNPFTPQESLRYIYKKLKNHNEINEIINSLLKNIATEKEIKIEIINNYDDWYVHSINTSDYEVLEAIYLRLKHFEKYKKNFFNEFDYVFLIENSFTPNYIVEELSKSKYLDIKLAAILSGKLSENRLIELAKQKNIKILKAIAKVAQTENVFNALFENEKSRNEEVYEEMAININTPIELINNEILPYLFKDYEEDYKERYYSIDSYKVVGILLSREGIDKNFFDFYKEKYPEIIRNEKELYKEIEKEFLEEFSDINDFIEYIKEKENIVERIKELSYYYNEYKYLREQNIIEIFNAIMPESLLEEKDILKFKGMYRFLNNNFFKDLKNFIKNDFEKLNTNALKILLVFYIENLTYQQLLDIKSEIDSREAMN